MMKKYRLKTKLKTFQGNIQNEIFTESVMISGSRYERIYISDRNDYLKLSAWFVENNPDWFEEIKEKKSANEIIYNYLKNRDPKLYDLGTYTSNFIQALKNEGYRIIQDIEATEEEIEEYYSMLWNLTKNICDYGESVKEIIKWFLKNFSKKV